MLGHRRQEGVVPADAAVHAKEEERFPEGRTSVPPPTTVRLAEELPEIEVLPPILKRRQCLKLHFCLQNMQDCIINVFGV